MKQILHWGAAGLLLLAMGPTNGRSAAPVAFSQAQTEAAHSLPKVVYLIRHAEKPEGDKDNPDLTPVGFHRAELLPLLFNKRTGVPALPRPDVLFAADTSKHSNRPIETVTPLSRALHMKLEHPYGDHDDAAMSKLLLSGPYGDKVVFVCWRHGELPGLARALGVTDAPKKWDEDVYDIVWEIKWVNGVAQMKVLHEMLLPGDSKP